MEQSESSFTRAVALDVGRGAALDAACNAAGDRLATITDAGRLQVWACPVTQEEWELLHTEQVRWCCQRRGISS
jgi:hypothetical protein